MDIQELQQWFKDHVTIYDNPYLLDDEQAGIVLDNHKNTIVTARAGSGKTHTLVAKIVYLVAKKGVDPKQIMALGFNKGPQDDFQKRLANVRIDGIPIINGNHKIARTFHSFAYDIANIPGDILFDIDQNSYIENIVNTIVDPRHIYDYIRDDSHEPKREDYENDVDYYAAVKYMRYDTLSGETVKSRGEKIISDYLFEHGIANTYEAFSLFPSKLEKYAKTESDAQRLKQVDKITPDFCIETNDRKILWEHWGIRGDETDDEIDQINESGFVGQYSDYYAKKEFKEWFYSKEWLDEDKIQSPEAKQDKYLSVFIKCDSKIIATNYIKGIERKKFEDIIRDKLSSFSINNEKLPQEALISRFRDSQENMASTVSRVTQFIQRAEQQFPGNYNGLRRECERIDDAQVKKFYKVALASYGYYIDELTADPTRGPRGLIDKQFTDKIYTDDYAMLMARAAERIRDGENGKQITIEEIKYLFLDEYQDFSLLFHNLVKAIQLRNPSLKLLAVGDDWQAINSYAGASLEYFEQFESYFPENCARLRISANRRSEKSIVEIANLFMKNSLGDDSGSSAIKNDTSNDVLNNCTLSEIRNFWEDGKHAEKNNQQKYNLLLAEIINSNKGKTFKILNRTNDVKFDEYDRESLKKFERDFKQKYRKMLADVDIDNDVDFLSVNSSKGLESDIVVILETDMGRFPIFHPDNYLYKVFGESEQKALDEQKRLFYVALTRAKEKLYIVHKNGYVCTAQDKSGDFLKFLEINEIPRYSKPSFLPMEQQIIDGHRDSFRATSIKIVPNRYNPNNVDIIAETTNHDIVRQWNAFSDGGCANQLRRLSKICSKTSPVRIITALKKSFKANRTYIWMYDGTHPKTMPHN